MANVTLTKASTGGTVNLGFPGTVAYDAAWTSPHGHNIYRGKEANGNTAYWLMCLEGRPSKHETLADASASVDWLHERGR